jgi:hypothetical protein
MGQHIAGVRRVFHLIICSIAITATSTTVAAEKSPNGFSERHKAAVAAIEKGVTRISRVLARCGISSYSQC